MNTLKVYKVRQNAKLPTRAHPNDAGLDIYYCPDPAKVTGCFNENGECVIAPRKSVLLPAGIKLEIPKGYMFEIKNKSGIASMTSCVVGANVVDSGFSGEVMVNLHNIGAYTKVFQPGEKVAQGVLIPVSLCDIVEVLDESEINQDSTRGINGFGSSGRF